MVRVILWTLSWMVAWAIAWPVSAAVCRTYHEHQICVISIERSAKNFWEYRAALQVDGVARPVEVYDCRDRLRILRDGKTIPFDQDAAGDFVCTLLRR